MGIKDEKLVIPIIAHSVLFESFSISRLLISAYSLRKGPILEILVIHNLSSTMSIVVAVTLDDLDRFLHDAREKLAVIMFTSPSCAACRSVEPKINQLATDFGNRVMFIKVDVNRSDNLAHRYHIHLLPTFMFMRYGKSLEKFSGADAPTLSKKINEILNK